MAKRQIPLFIFDLSRHHGLGECDFVNCTDVECGFVASVTFHTAVKEEVGDTFRITAPNPLGISAKIEIKRIVGTHPEQGRIRTLLKKAMDEYIVRTQTQHVGSTPDDSQLITFLDEVIRSNQHRLHQAGSDYTTRQIIQTSLRMLQSIKDRIRKS